MSIWHHRGSAGPSQKWWFFVLIDVDRLWDYLLPERLTLVNFVRYCTNRKQEVAELPPLPPHSMMLFSLVINGRVTGQPPLFPVSAFRMGLPPSLNIALSQLSGIRSSWNWWHWKAHEKYFKMYVSDFFFFSNFFPAKWHQSQKNDFGNFG